ncbi:MAG: hypothetical protein JWM58_3735 [Rhizobium sp.]|nr:hypothetical protein [Rhizobium sp.]
MLFISAPPQRKTRRAANNDRRFLPRTLPAIGMMGYQEAPDRWAASIKVFGNGMAEPDLAGYILV